MIKKTALLFFVLALLAPLPFAHAGEKEPLVTLRQIPVQQGGRVKPFQSFAKEAVLYVTGRTRFADKEPTLLIWEWIANPEKWAAKPLIPVSYHALRDEFGLMLVGNRISPEIVLQHKPFLDEVRDAAARRQKKEDLTEIEKKRLSVYEKALMFQKIGEGTEPGFVAHPDEPSAGWLPLQSLILPEGREILSQHFPAAAVEQAGKSLGELAEAVRADALTPETASAFKSSLEALFDSRQIQLDKRVLNAEISYNNLNPFHWAWILYFTGFFFSLFISVFRKRSAGATKFFEALSLAGFLAGFLVHAYGFYLRCVIAGRPPVSNMYESMIWVSWAVAFFALILYFFYRSLMIRNTAALVAGFALLLAQNFPVALNAGISPLVPVLRSNLWLTVHVLTITLSYGAFALAWGLGHVVLFHYAFDRNNHEKHRQVSQYLYRAIQIGVVLLAAGTILGGVWANYSWGRFWGWDPKETWALIALLGYLVVLHGRFSGWVGPFGIAVGSVLAFLGVIMAWYGVNFVLAAGLHSYGFGGGGLKYVLTCVAIDLTFVGGLVVYYKTNGLKKLTGAAS